MKYTLLFLLLITFTTFSHGQSAKLSTAEHLRLARELSGDSSNSAKQAKAVYHYRVAATRGDADAMGELAWHYLYGVGVRKSYVDALDLAKLAAKSDTAYGHFILGMIHMNGSGVQKSNENAAACFRNALRVDRDCWNAYLFLGELYEFEYGELSKAEENYRSAARLEVEQNAGDGSANYRLGVWYEEGIFYEQSMSAAIAQYDIAWKKGDYRGSRRIGFLHYEGKGLPKNAAKAVEFFEIGADNNHAESQFTLAECYHKGIGVERSVQKSDSYVRLAAKNGHKKAQQLVTNQAIGNMVSALFGGGSLSGGENWDSQSEAGYRANDMPPGLGGNGAR